MTTNLNPQRIENRLIEGTISIQKKANEKNVVSIVKLGSAHA